MTSPFCIEDFLRDPTYPQKSILEKLLMHRLDVDRTWLLTHIEHEISPADRARIDRAYHAYTVEHQPLEYIVGNVVFGGKIFAVGPATLIPRPETEYMIEAVSGRLPSCSKDIVLIDVGTGCGVLGVSTLLHAGAIGASITHAYLTDYSPEALAVAQENYAHHQADLGGCQKTPVTWLHSDLLDNSRIHDHLRQLHDQHHLLIVANLPYIPDQTFEEQVEPRVKKREPKMAFVGGDDGLDLYRRMLDQLLDMRLVVPITMFLEMMTWQVDILRNAYPQFTREEVQTFHMNIRIVKVCG